MSNALTLPTPQSISRLDIRTLEYVACWVMAVAVVFVNGADFRGASGAESFEVHWQIYLRIAVSLTCGGLAVLLFYPRAATALVSWPGFLVPLQFIWLGLCIPFGIEKSFCFAAWLCVASVSLFVPVAMRILGATGTVSAVGVGLLLYQVGSWIAFLVFPEIGVAKEFTSQTEFVERMGGLGHPNELGFYSAFTILLFTSIGMSRRLSWFIVLPIIALAFASLVGSFSRTATVVTCLGLAITMQNYWKKNIIVPLLLTLLGVGFAFSIIASGEIDWIMDRVLTKITKSGSAQELSSATGRDEIWRYGISQIAESPLVGFGYGSHRFVMVDHSFHCHNIILNAAMAGGIPAAGFIIAQLVYCVWSMLFRPCVEIDGIASCFLLGGMIEGLISGPTPSAGIFFWTMILFWRAYGFQLAGESPKPKPPNWRTYPSVSLR